MSRYIGMFNALVQDCQRRDAAEGLVVGADRTDNPDTVWPAPAADASPDALTVMQLRVARLCLDCEELHVEDACPVCASERYAFMSTWLPSEERRRWRRPVPTPAPRPTGMAAIVGSVLAWLRLEPPADRPPHPITRASDRVPDLTFDPDAARPPKPPALETRPAKHDVR
jgi:hypothetical protein